MKKIAFIGLGFLLSSCLGQGECSDISSNILKVGFYNFSDRKTKTIELDSVTILGVDTILYEGEKVNIVKLPLNPEWETVTFHLHYSGSVSSLEVKYQIKTFPLAPDCVAIDLYTITVATGTTVKEIAYPLRDITRSNNENLQLYF